jgi:hypothetical protein
MLFLMLVGLIEGLVHILVGIQSVCTVKMLKMMAVLVEMMGL